MRKLKGISPNFSHLEQFLPDAKKPLRFYFHWRCICLTDHCYRFLSHCFLLTGSNHDTCSAQISVAHENKTQQLKSINAIWWHFRHYERRENTWIFTNIVSSDKRYKMILTLKQRQWEYCSTYYSIRIMFLSSYRLLIHFVGIYIYFT